MSEEAEATANPVGDGGGAADDVESVLSLESVGARVAALERRDNKELEKTVSNVFAQFAEAPTNWHQATIYFLSSTEPEDAPARKLAPLMFVVGLTMVLLQIMSVYGLISGMVHPSCNSNTQCERPGFFCYMVPGEDRGTCQMCGEMPPLVPYRSTTEKLTAEQVANDRTNNAKYSPIGLYKEYNLIWDMSYPQQAGGGRSKTPEWFAGWNYSMVESTCSLPIRPFNWEFSREGPQGSGTYTITDRGDIPEGVDLTRIYPISGYLAYTHFDAPCVARWCDACVEHDALDHGDGLSVADEGTRLTVSIMNKKLLAETSVKGACATSSVLCDV